MDLKIEGRLIQKLALQTGTGKNGEWRKQEFVIETEDAFPKKICANLWSDKIGQLDAVNIGDKITLYFNLESREFNGRWYTDVRGWKIDKMGSAPATATDAMPQPVQTPTPAPIPTPEMPAGGPADMNDGSEAQDDLPF